MQIEKWVDVVGHSGRYKVSTFGRVKSLSRKITCKGRGDSVMIRHHHGRILKQVIASHSGPYPVVCLANGGGPAGKNRNSYVHAIVLNAFVGPCPDGMECRHLDGDKTNNNLTNLKWGTPAENANDRDLHGKTAKGWRIAASKISNEKRQAIMDLRKECGYGIKLLARVFGKTEMTIKYLIGTYAEYMDNTV